MHLCMNAEMKPWSSRLCWQKGAPPLLSCDWLVCHTSCDTRVVSTALWLAACSLRHFCWDLAAVQAVTKFICPVLSRETHDLWDSCPWMLLFAFIYLVHFSEGFQHNCLCMYGLFIFMQAWKIILLGFFLLISCTHKHWINWETMKCGAEKEWNMIDLKMNLFTSRASFPIR